MIELTEQDIRQIVKESVDKVLNEVAETTGGQRILGRLAKRKQQRGETFNNGYKGNFDSLDVENYAARKRNSSEHTNKERQKMGQAFYKGRYPYSWA